jgi:hypothetical protein
MVVTHTILSDLAGENNRVLPKVALPGCRGVKVPEWLKLSINVVLKISAEGSRRSAGSLPGKGRGASFALGQNYSCSSESDSASITKWS